MDNDFKKYAERTFSNEEYAEIIHFMNLFEKKFPYGISPMRQHLLFTFADRCKSSLAIKIRDKLLKSKKYKSQIYQLYTAIGLSIVLK